MTSRSLLVCSLFLVCMSPAQAERPTGWRTDATGRYTAEGAVNRWSGNSNVLWRTAMPDWSNGTPAIHGDRIYVVSEPNALLCVRRSDGKLLWTRKLKDSQERPRSHRANGYTSATPCTDGELVFSVYGTGQVACYTVGGEKKWSKSVGLPNHKHGHSASPILADGKLIVHMANGLFGLDPESGNQLWKTDSRQAWGTPVLTRVGDLGVLVLANGDIIGVKDGKKLASDLGRLVYSSPVIRDGVAYFVCVRSSAVKLTSDGKGGIVTKQLWKRSLGRGRRTRYYASAQIYKGLIYTLEQRNNLVVLDAKTGETVYEKRLPLGRGTCYPSITLAGTQLMASSDNGTTIVFEPGRSYEQSALNKLPRFRACLVFVGSRMYVRANEALFCIGPKGKKAGAPAKTPKEQEKKKDDEFHE